jgi:hypothetical protein
MCSPQIIKSFQNYRGVATTFYPTLISMPSARFEPTVSSDDRPQTYDLDLAATGTGIITRNEVQILACLLQASSVIVSCINSRAFPSVELLTNFDVCRSQWPRGLGRGSSAARLLRLWVRIPPGVWMFVV